MSQYLPIFVNPTSPLINNQTAGNEVDQANNSSKQKGPLCINVILVPNLTDVY